MRTVWTILLALALMTGVACFPDDVNNVGGDSECENIDSNLNDCS